MFNQIDPNIMLSFLGMIIGSGGMAQFIMSRHDKRVEHDEELKQKKKELEKQEQAERDDEIKACTQKVQDLVSKLINMSCASVQDRIVHLVNKSAQKGYITAEHKAVITAMYEPYKELGKNHYAKSAMELLDTIPIVSEDVADELDRKHDRKYINPEDKRLSIIKEKVEKEKENE